MQHLTIQTKLLISLIAGMAGSAVLKILEYTQDVFINNLIFILLIFFVYVIDIGFGIAKHLKLNDFSFRALLLHAMLKIYIGFGAMLIFNAFGFVLQEDATIIKTYFVMVGKLLTMTYYAGSAFNSMSVLTNGKFPPISWMKRMREFNKTLNPKVLTSDDINQN
jgi:hypothetical protein